MYTYDPEHAPDVQAWLAMDEQQRIDAAYEFHRNARVRIPSAARTIHAALHVVVETQLAKPHEPAVRAMARLQADGMSRHDALHAVGSIVAEYISTVTRSEPGAHPSAERYDQALDNLTAASWRALIAPPPKT